MRKIIAFVCIVALPYIAKCDVVFTAPQYTFASYSVELIYSYEVAKSLKRSTSVWGGVGMVGSIYYIYTPSFGVEIAIEARRYLKPEIFRGFFCSWYIGAAAMRGVDVRYDLGVVPGFKFNYKANLAKSLALEPYIGISIPFTLNMRHAAFYVPFPVATIGIRLGINKLKNNAL